MHSAHRSEQYIYRWLSDQIYWVINIPRGATSSVSHSQTQGVGTLLLKQPRVFKPQESKACSNRHIAGHILHTSHRLFVFNRGVRSLDYIVTTFKIDVMVFGEYKDSHIVLCQDACFGILRVYVTSGIATTNKKQACCAGCRRRPFPMQLHQQAKSTHLAKSP